ncbi:hypothetical protein L1987_44347 [Smallanthus sonchifolius]|uniref:Uncharacterized protein n=1 Tax=Smallanthus sonchifolius TaxID=185202 RepID=A0ACB9GR91_9ASTR|nr:hypothetical protein L1987_44347 [Smallanthus sonchifolius]
MADGFVKCCQNGGSGSHVKRTTLHDLYEKQEQSPWYDNLCRPVTDLIPLIESGVRGKALIVSDVSLNLERCGAGGKLTAAMWRRRQIGRKGSKTCSMGVEVNGSAGPPLSPKKRIAGTTMLWWRSIDDCFVGEDNRVGVFITDGSPFGVGKKI